MARRAEKTGKWRISKHAFYAALHFAYQYNEWRKELSGMTDTVKAIQYSDMPKGGNPDQDPTCTLVARREQLVKNTDLVEQCAHDADPDLYEYILLGVTNEGVTYDHLKMMKNIPCGKDMYYDRRRKFYYLLGNKLNL